MKKFFCGICVVLSFLISFAFQAQATEKKQKDDKFFIKYLNKEIQTNPKNAENYSARGFYYFEKMTMTKRLRTIIRQSK